MWKKLIQYFVLFAGSSAVVLSGYELFCIRTAAAAQESYIASLAESLPEALRPGLANHLQCAVFRTKTICDPASTLQPGYAQMVAQVSAQMTGYCLMSAHYCWYGSQKSIHLLYTQGEKEVSVVVRRKDHQGETQVGELYQTDARQFTLSAVETDRYWIYVVSEQSQQANSAMLAAVAPAVQRALP